jgi:hypothetical protein
MPKSRAEAGRVEMSLPPWMMRPEVWMSRPAIARKRVVLPQPEGPRMQTNSPLLTVAETSLSATMLSNDLLTPSTRR